MMGRIDVVQGDLLQDQADIIVCPVNCQRGVMGAGLALGFKQRFKNIEYCHASDVSSQQLYICHPTMTIAREPGGRDVRVVFFPTKNHWKQPSRADWVFRGLANLYGVIDQVEPKADRVDIAIPALGCGLGGLPFQVVGPMILSWAAGLPGRFHVRLYRPHEGTDDGEVAQGRGQESGVRRPG